MDKKLIVQASEKLELLDIILYESNFKRFTESHNQLKLGQQNKLSVRAETGEAIDNENSPINIFRVFIELGIRVNNVSNQETQQELLYQVEATFRVDYELKSDINEEALKEFAHFNAVHNVWPFWRQFVFSTTNQAHLPCPEIPLRKPQA